MVGILSSLALVGIQYVAAWNLDVSLTNPPFGVKNVRVELEGPFGWKTYKIINWQQQVNLQGATSGVVHVYFTIPPNVIPLNYKYKVLTYNLVSLLDTFLPHQKYFTHTYEPSELLSMSVR